MNEQLRQYILRHHITFGVVVALSVAVVVTMASMALYVSSGASRLDLSRPGYEKARGEVSDDEKETEFSPTGPVTSASLRDFQSRFDKQRESLGKLGSFDSTALDDTELRLVDATVEAGAEPVQ